MRKEEGKKEQAHSPSHDTVLRVRKDIIRQDISRANPKSPIVVLNVQ